MGERAIAPKGVEEAGKARVAGPARHQLRRAAVLAYVARKARRLVKPLAA